MRCASKTEISFHSQPRQLEQLEIPSERPHGKTSHLNQLMRVSAWSTNCRIAVHRYGQESGLSEEHAEELRQPNGNARDPIVGLRTGHNLRGNRASNETHT